MKPEYFSSSSGQTKKIAETIAREIIKIKPGEKAIVLGLKGELGSGKTTFLQGFARGLGIKEKILSPTFVIYKKFQIPSLRKVSRRETNTNNQSNPKSQILNFKNFYHLDCYRLQEPKELLTLGFKKIISNPQNIVAVEWAEKIKKILPKNTIWLNFEFIDEKTRKIAIKNLSAES